LNLISLIGTLIRPCRLTLLAILFAMIVQTVMSIAGPWPLKIVLDNVVGSHKAPAWLDGLLGHAFGGHSKMQIAIAVAAGLTQIGVLSFAVVQVARSSGMVAENVFSTAIAASLISILLNVFIVRGTLKWVGGKFSGRGKLQSATVTREA
jgi:predicted Kef-type K+ transport protein